VISINRSRPDGVLPASIQLFEEVSLIVLDFVFMQKSHVFLTKAPPGIVPFLLADLTDDGAKLRMAVGESTETFLPEKASPPLTVPSIFNSKAAEYSSHVQLLIGADDAHPGFATFAADNWSVRLVELGVQLDPEML
jgi:hypothetical protein